jgi:hypothetical protein
VEAKMNNGLSFREDGTFTIVQFTDVHWQNGDEPDLRTRELMQRVLKEESPDLIVFTGDVIYSLGCREPEQALREAVTAADQSGIPWAVVFGNHDSEGNVTRERLMEVLREFENCLTKHTPSVSGFGNFVLNVSGKDRGTDAALYFLDSGQYSTITSVGGYGWVNRDQIDWYVSESRMRTNHNGGIPLSALVFFHIPLQEYAIVWERGGCFGHKYEEVCAPQLNSGLFAAMVEMGDVMGAFAGHDHINDYWGEMHGIRLAYGRATGYNAYGKEGFARGARVIRLSAGKREFESWLRLEDGSVDFQN